MRGYGEGKPDLMIKIGFTPPEMHKKKRARKYGEDMSEEDEEEMQAGMEAARRRLAKKYGSRK